MFAEVTPGVFRALFLVALKTGMREGELIALRWADVDLTGAGSASAPHLRGRPRADA